MTTLDFHIFSLLSWTDGRLQKGGALLPPGSSKVSDPSGPAMRTQPYPGAPSKGFHRPLGIAILSILIILGGVIVIILGVAVLAFGGLLGFAFAGAAGAALGAAIGGIIIIVGAVWLVAGLGLWRLRGWAWWLATIVVGLSLAGSAVNGGIGAGLIVTALIFVYLLVVKKHFNQ